MNPKTVQVKQSTAVKSNTQNTKPVQKIITKLDSSKLRKYQRMLELLYRKYGPSKSTIELKTDKKIKYPIMAGIDTQTWDVQIILREDLDLGNDPELIQFLEKRNIVDAIEKLIRNTGGHHEMGHWEFPKGGGFGCPYDRVTQYDVFIETAYEELVASGRFDERFCKAMSMRVSNAIMDVINNYNIQSELERIGENFSGQTLFWYLQGKEHGDYNKEYDLFVKLNLVLFGNRDDFKLLKRFFVKGDPELSKAVRELKQIFSEANIYDRSQWEMLTREYTKRLIPFLEMEKPPQHQTSAGDKTSKPQKPKDPKQKEDKQDENESKDDSQCDEPSESDQGNEQDENTDPNSGQGESEGEENSEDENQGNGGASDEKEDSDEDQGNEQNENTDPNSGQGESEDEESNLDFDEDNDSNSGQGESEEQDPEEDEEGGYNYEELDEDEDSEQDPGEELTKIEKQRIMGKRDKGERGVPWYIQRAEALDAYYSALAQDIEIKAHGELPKPKFPIVPVTYRSYDPTRDSVLDIELSKFEIDFEQKRAVPVVAEQMYSVDVPMQRELTGIPEFMFVLLDASGSMMDNEFLGRNVVVSWGEESYYHYGLLTINGIIRYFEIMKILNRMKWTGGIFHDYTLTVDGLEQAKQLWYNPTTGATRINIRKVIQALEGKKDAVFGLITDGEIENWWSIKERFIEAAKRNQFFMIQIGEETSASNDLREEGLTVETVHDHKDIVQLGVDLTRKKYDQHFENRAKARRKHLGAFKCD